MWIFFPLKKLSAAEIRAEGLDKERLANVPVDAQKEIQELKSKVVSVID